MHQTIVLDTNIYKGSAPFAILRKPAACTNVAGPKPGTFCNSSRDLKGPYCSLYLTIALATRVLIPDTCLSKAAEAELTSTPAKLTQETTTRSSIFASSF